MVRMAPVAYSEVTISAPSTPTTNWEMNSPVWENRTGSNWARSTGPREAQRPASMLETRAESPMPATTTTARAIQVERTERSLVHSDTTERAPRPGRAGRRQRSAPWPSLSRRRGHAGHRHAGGAVEVDGVGGQLHEDVLEAGLLGAQLVEGDPRPVGGVADLGGGGPVTSRPPSASG